MRDTDAIPLEKLGPSRAQPEERPSGTEVNAVPVRISKIRVFLVTENRLLRDTLSQLLRRQGDTELAGSVGNGQANPEEVGKSGCDVVLLDFIDPEWISVVREQSKEARREINILVIGRDAETVPFLEAVRCGVTGYLLKDASAGEVVTAVRASVRGEASCSAQLCTVLFQTVAQMEPDRRTKEPRCKTRLTLR